VRGRAFSVCGAGIGLPAGKVQAVLKPFQRVGGGFQEKYNGSGLGLSSSDALTKLHGGRIESESELDVGTSVTVIFPTDRLILEGASDDTAHTDDTTLKAS